MIRGMFRKPAEAAEVRRRGTTEKVVADLRRRWEGVVIESPAMHLEKQGRAKFEWRGVARHLQRQHRCPGEVPAKLMSSHKYFAVPTLAISLAPVQARVPTSAVSALDANAGRVAVAPNLWVVKDGLGYRDPKQSPRNLLCV
ncbi:hypothetical protein GCM10007874_32750 [Labrys miyagiensis]|uniref:Transposase n=1 Tax=Labrys miyagiensis TaxID=346912 RepID=A0ABQ6CKJ2_9HYPH|nr:hypothetical protein GCM10007874_32750 [Labrys miyagiensis]